MMWQVILIIILTGNNALPQFEAYWESQESYLYNEDELNNPWYIDLGNIAAGSSGNLNGPSIVTIGFADVCTNYCQEHYPDEFCSKYPPEGVPAKPRTVDDWGTKFNITSNIMTKGIPALKAKGAKVHLSYGILGLHPLGGGGVYDAAEDMLQALYLVDRIVQNVFDWDLDGVDIYTTGGLENFLAVPGQSVGFHYRVIKNLRHALPAGKTISYTVARNINTDPGQDLYAWHPMEEVIGLAHKYMDYINIGLMPEFEEITLDFLTNELGVPAYKIGWMLEHSDDMEEKTLFLVNSIKQRGLRGLSFFTVNKENNQYRGQFLKQIAQHLYT